MEPHYGLRGKYLQVELVDQSHCEGYLYAVDPVSHHTLLMQPTEDIKDIGDQLNLRTFVVAGHAIKSFQVIQDKPECTIPLTPEYLELSLTQIGGNNSSSSNGDSNIHAKNWGNVQRSKEFVRQILEKSHLAVSEEDGQLSVHHGILTIAPPYTPLSCKSTNPMVLARVQRLLMEAMERNKAKGIVDNI